jgi:hypothetical protein
MLASMYLRVNKLWCDERGMLCGAANCKTAFESELAPSILKRATSATARRRHSKSHFETRRDDHVSKSSLFAKLGLHTCRLMCLNGTKMLRQLEGPLAQKGPRTLTKAVLSTPANDRNGQKSSTKTASSDN